MAVQRQRRIAQGVAVKMEGGKTVEEYQTSRLLACIETLQWFVKNEQQIRDFMKLPLALRIEAIHFAYTQTTEQNDGPSRSELPACGSGSLPDA